VNATINPKMIARRNEKRETVPILGSSFAAKIRATAKDTENDLKFIKNDSRPEVPPTSLQKIALPVDASVAMISITYSILK
jgi:hypothetical protein